MIYIFCDIDKWRDDGTESSEEKLKFYFRYKNIIWTINIANE